MRDVDAGIAACLTADGTGARPLHLLTPAAAGGFLAQRPAHERRWLEDTGFVPKPGRTALLPGPDGSVAAALAVTQEPASLWDVAAARAVLPAGTWRLEGGPEPAEAAIAWALAAYRFERYRRDERPAPVLHLAAAAARARARAVAAAVWLARDLITTPANDLGPAELAAAIAAVAERAGAECRTIVGAELLEAGFPLVHAVGRAAARAPRLVELRWGRAEAPRVTLVGKGVCFDTGGLDIKPSAGMLMMRKDMGGAAVMLGLARAIMDLGLDVRLRLLVPAVENSVGGDAFRPGDVLPSRKGLTVEIGNTDAEGRLILADALALADAEAPALLLDAATLTGAARVALGPDLPALFTPDDGLAQDLAAAGQAVAEPVWRLPLHAGYARYLESPVADLVNAGAKPFAGATTAALFLERFVTTTRAWAHLDIFAWNDEARPGRPKGGEATGLRPLLHLVERRFGAGAGAGAGR
jgi:leucyl aminopeptidase